MNPARKIIAALLCIGACHAGHSQTTYTSTTTADAFLPTGSPGNPAGSDLTYLNYGGAGTLVVAPSNSVKGEFQSVIKFNVADAITLFDTTYGSNNWTISSITLDLTSNYGTQGVQPNNPIFPTINTGSFVIEWLADDNWVEGTGNPSLPTTDGVCYDSLATNLLLQTHIVLCTNTYVPPGNNIHVTWPLPLQTNLVADVTAGGDVSFLFYAADTQVTYLFNSYFYGRGNEPLIHVTAISSLKITAGYFTGGVFHLAGHGAPNTGYQIQANTNLSTTNWQSLGTAMSDGAGGIQFDDTNASTQAQRFYRLSN